jgi:putative methionine-R-sulfoxide reductase with GAF domain
MKAKTSKPKSSRSLTLTLAIAFTSLSAVVLLISSGLQLFSNIQNQQVALSRQQELIAQEASKAVSSFVEEQFRVLETAIDLADPASISAQEREVALASLLGLQPAFRQLVLLNAQDRQLAEATRLLQASSDEIVARLSEDALAQIRQGARYISPIYIDDATSEPLVVMALPVANVFGDFQGTLAVEVNLKFMWDLVDQLQVGETGYAYVVDNQGNLIAFQDTGRVLKGENVGHIDEVKEFIENPTASGDVTPEVASYTGLLGTNVVGTYVPLGTPEWAVVTELPWGEAYQEVIGQGIWALVITLGIAFLAGLLGIYIARRLSAPLVELSNIATEVAGGNLTMVARVAGPAEIAQVASTFNEMTSRLREFITTLEQRVADRTKALATSAEVTRHLAAILDPRQLAVEVVNEVRNAFDYYYAQIYLLDEADENLVIAGGTGEAGATMLARGHSLPKGSGLVGRAADANASVLVPDVSREEGWLPNELLPETKSEAAIPISIGNQVMGVLDVQHNLVDGLTHEDVILLESLAGQVAISLRNARSYEQSRSQAEMQALVNVIGQKIQRTTSVEETLQTAIRELGTAIGATRVRARIGDTSPAVEPVSVSHGGNGAGGDSDHEQI